MRDQAVGCGVSLTTFLSGWVKPKGRAKSSHRVLGIGTGGDPEVRSVPDVNVPDQTTVRLLGQKGIHHTTVCSWRVAEGPAYLVKTLCGRVTGGPVNCDELLLFREH